MNFKSALLLSIMISCLILYSCSGGENKNITAATDETAEEIHPWSNVPVFPDAEFISQSATELPSGYQSSIVREYETVKNPQVIHSFYKARMPFLGWKSHGGNYVEGEYQSTWGKDDNDIMVWITARSDAVRGKTRIELIRAEK
ncbi:MAG: hypothetical protein JW755_08935 [Candidatus Aminicenantes bacterium]|nr:hypothetical protein [Candidatus Aminicenantes bacterium]